MKEIAIGLIGGALIALFLLLATAEAHGQENCPLDWHPPPCGNPGPLVKPAKHQNIIDAERYHWKAMQVLGAWAVVTCSAGKWGTPYIEAVVKASCGLATIAAAASGGMAQMESRYLDALKSMAEGAPGNFMAKVPVTSLAGYEAGNPYYDALNDHIGAIEWLWGLAVESIQQTRNCDDWAQTHVVDCNGPRQWTDDLLSYIGERYVAASWDIEALTQPLIDEIGNGVNEEMINALYEEIVWDDYTGRGLQQ